MKKGLEPEFLKHLAIEVEAVTGQSWNLESSPEFQSGGCINESYTLKGTPVSYFLKLNSLKAAPMFIAEADALKIINGAQAIKAPHVICQGIWEQQSYLVLESIQLSRHGSIDERASRELGRQLANLHKHVSPNGQHGWQSDNFIGTTIQPNTWMQQWPEFWQVNRLGWQIKLAADKGIAFKGAERLLDKVPEFFADYSPAPSLLHGDLWGGNASFDEAGNPVIYDPASYYGDRETDLAFTQLFGGFSPAFYEAYDETWPRNANWKRRKELYNLYHILNHHHLFGGHYASSAQDMIHALNRMV